MKNYKNKNETSILVVSHDKNILDYIVPDKVHIIKDGHIVSSGDEKILKTL